MRWRHLTLSWAALTRRPNLPSWSAPLPCHVVVYRSASMCAHRESVTPGYTPWLYTHYTYDSMYDTHGDYNVHNVMNMQNSWSSYSSWTSRKDEVGVWPAILRVWAPVAPTVLCEVFDHLGYVDFRQLSDSTLLSNYQTGVEIR